MKICLAQTKPVKGDIKENILHHLHFIELALGKGANMIVFPELSITGYEPELAGMLATDSDDIRFNAFQKISDNCNIVIAFGLPINTGNGINISLLIVQPGKARKLYSKKYLHQDELPFFVPGKNFPVLTATEPLIAFAICYELSVPEHVTHAVANGAGIYIASVAKTAIGMENASRKLAAIAAQYSMPALVVNCIGACDNFESAGHSAIWNSSGNLLAQLDSLHEGILVFDSSTGAVAKEIV